jgi:glucoamylase
MLGGAGAVVLGAGGTAVHRARRAVVPLYSETVAFSAPGVRELVHTARLVDLVPGTRVVDRTGHADLLVGAEQVWLDGCADWVRSVPDEDGMLRSALLDLHALSSGLPVSVAGWSPRWRYAWPRDVSFVAAALARVGRPDDAVRQLAFLQHVQGADGWFEARYDIHTGRAPDARQAQLDGSGWTLWAADQVARHAPDRAAELLRPLRDLLVRSAAGLLACLDGTTMLPPVSSDYWELSEDTLTLGTAAAVLAGLRSAEGALTAIDELSLTDRTRAAAAVLAAQVTERFGADGYPRRLGGWAADAAITFLVPPIGPSEPSLEVLLALDRAQTALARPAGGLAPGARWKNDGISWTPETALFAAAWAATGHRTRAEELLRWLAEHRTAAGSYPEKVLHDGRPAAVAPLAWTAALVVIARHELAAAR